MRACDAFSRGGVRGVIEVTVISDQIGGRASGSNC